MTQFPFYQEAVQSLLTVLRLHNGHPVLHVLHSAHNADLLRVPIYDMSMAVQAKVKCRSVLDIVVSRVCRGAVPTYDRGLAVGVRASACPP